MKNLKNENKTLYRLWKLHLIYNKNWQGGHNTAQFLKSGRSQKIFSKNKLHNRQESHKISKNMIEKISKI